MHGLSIASGLVDNVLKSIKDYDVKEVIKIDVVLGELAGISPAELRNGFSIASSGTLLQNAKLNIQINQSRIRCSECGYEGGVESALHHEHLHLAPRCPECKGLGVEILTGDEITLKNLEVELR
jgi:hydrogenase nickel incorporation protein HypA/HybF